MKIVEAEAIPIRIPLKKPYTIVVPKGPGLGVTVDEEKVARYRAAL